MEEGVEESLALDKAVSVDPFSESSFEIIAGWIANCERYHGEACNGHEKKQEDNGGGGGGGGGSWPGLPSRVLDVSPPEHAGNEDMICLRTRDSILNPKAEGKKKKYEDENEEVDKRYTALSHCWGAAAVSEPFCTTRANMRDRMAAIRVSAMPRTFRDAVAVARRLRFRYVWIDSLCIVQDDAADWAVEAADMSNVYSHCGLLLAAARGASDDAGFLQSRTQTDAVVVVAAQSPAPVTATATAEESSERRRRTGRVDERGNNRAGLELQLQLLPPVSARWTSDETIDPMGEEPLNARAWCLQERVLPTRKLFWGSTQMFWECPTLRESESGKAVEFGMGHLGRICRTGALATSVFLRRLPAVKKKKKEEEGEEDDCESGRRNVEEEDEAEEEDKEEVDAHDSKDKRWIDWYQMVEEYSTRSITRDDDRLVALGGLARLVSRATDSSSNHNLVAASNSTNRYLAGIWETGLIEGLMWAGAHRSRDRDRELRLRQTSTYTAPSWSWASVAGPVQFLMYGWYAARAPWKSRFSNFEALASYSSSRISAREYEDEFGRLRLRQVGSNDTTYLTLLAPKLLPVAEVRKRSREDAAAAIADGVDQWAEMVPNRSGVTDLVLQLRCDGDGKGATSFWIDGALDTLDLTSIENEKDSLFVVFLSRLPHVGSTDKVHGHHRFLEHRFGLILQRTNLTTDIDGNPGPPHTYRRVGFVDGFILKQRRRWFSPFGGHLSSSMASFFGLEGHNAMMTRELENASYQCDDSSYMGGNGDEEDDDYDRYGEPENIHAPNPLVLKLEEVVL
ncbi:heterokaryon incompatibility protein-domain-containing protein, partial [Xylariaceae sp. FL0594]